jgi:hypothetical protein
MKYDATWLVPWSNYSPLKVKAGGKQSFHAGFFSAYFFDPEDGGDMFLRNVG